MTESFEERVKRLFGSQLFDKVPKSSFPTSSWSVAHGEVERQEWIRDKSEDREREDDPCSSAFYDKDGCLFKNRRSKRDKQREFEGDLDDLDDDEEEEDAGERDRKGEDDEEREENEIRSSVGLDPTLDNEDEEDEYDKAALCRENATERIYMKDIKDHGPDINYHAVIPDSLDDPSDESHYFSKDPRADHAAASVRIKEDKSATGSIPSLRKKSESSSDTLVKMSEVDANVKPILKRKEVATDPKPKKRVRFDPLYKDDNDEVSEGPRDFPMVPQTVEAREMPEVESRGIPDYLRNPSKYTCYTFDSSEDGDEETNRSAFADFCRLVKKSEPDDAQTGIPVELPKSLTFTPRKRYFDAVPMDDSPIDTKDNLQVSTSSLSIAAGESKETDATEMDEDGDEALSVDTSMSARRGRQYRAKSLLDDLDDLSD